MAASLWMAQSWEAIGEKELARQAIARAGGLSTRTALGEFMLGEYRLDEGKLDEALACFTRALRHRPDHLLSLLSMGRTLARRGRHEAAEAMFTGAIALSPTISFTYYERAVSRQSQGKFDLALEDLTRMAELAPGDYLPDYARAFIFNRRGDSAQALAMYDKVIEHNPGSFSSRLNRGMVYSQLGQLEKARADFSAVIDRLTPSMELVPRTQDWVNHLINARLARAEASERLGRRNEALADLEKALEVVPNSARIYHCRAAKIWMPAGRMKEAAHDLSKAIELEPDNAEHLWHRYECYLDLEQFDRALDDISRVVELLPDQPAGHLDRGIVLARLGRYADAVAEVERVLGRPAKANGKALTHSDYYNAACVYALASDRVAKDQAAAGRDAAAARFASRAIELLQQAVGSGWFGPDEVDHMRKDPDLDPVRKHPRFNEILKSAARENSAHKDGGHGHRAILSHDH
jgi:tetratricopeptide (TPR) repeat protein